MEAPTPSSLVCSHCGAQNHPHAISCAACDRPLLRPIGSGEVPPPPAGREALERRTIHLNTIMLVIALIAVCLGVLHESQGLGILLIVVAAPALLRTFMGAARQKARGTPMGWDQKLVTFAASVGIVSAIGLSASIAFVAVCFPVGLLSAAAGGWAGVVVAVLAGLVTGGIVLISVGRSLWPEKDL
jgi:hypothetical protein